MANLLVEIGAPINIIVPANYTGAAGVPDIVSMKNYHHLTFIVQTGAWAGGTAAVTLSQCQDVSATGAKALGLSYMWTNDGAVASDVLVKTAVVGDTFNIDTANAMYVVEVEDVDLDVANSFDCVRFNVASPGANNDYYGVTCIPSVPRYAAATPPSALID